MKKRIFVSGTGLALIILLSSQVMAQGGRIRLGKLKIIPGITVQEIYDDNIYLANGTNDTTELEESDWITHLQPGLLVQYSLGVRGSLSLGYLGDFARYSDNDDNDWQTHKYFFDLAYQAPGGLILAINNTYTDAEDPYGNDNEYKLGIPQTERWNNDLKSKIGYNFGNSFKVLAYCNYFKQDYANLEDYTQNYEEYEFGVGFQRRLLPKTWGFVRYHYGERDYYSHPAFVNGIATNSSEANDCDFSWHRVNAGLTWESGAKISGELNFGYKWSDYDNEFDAGGRKYDDEDTWIAATSITYAATPSTTLALNIVRAVRTTSADTKEYYDDTTVGISLQQALWRKLSLLAGFRYGNNDYNLPVARSREDDNYNANLELSYQLRDWLTAGIGYQYMRKDSNYVENDYTDNQVLVSVKAVY